MSKRTYSIDDVKAVILIGSRDFGRCPTATRLNRALWPVAGKPVLQRLIEHISSQGVRRFVLCCENYAAQTRQTLQLAPYLDVRFIEETMPRGTAGCVRDAAEPGREELLFVFGACTMMPPDLHQMVDSHRRSQAAMTVFFNPVSANGVAAPQDTQLYVCESSILEHIPEKGYFDIKEGLIPELTARGKDVSGITLAADCGHYKNWRQYLAAAGRFVNAVGRGDHALQGYRRIDPHRDVWAADGVRIAEDVRFCGTAVIGKGAAIAAEAVIVGPCLIEDGVAIGSKACMEQSVLWDQAVAAERSHLRCCLVDQQQRVPTGVKLSETLIPKPHNRLTAIIESLRRRLAPAAVMSARNITLAGLGRQPRLVLGAALFGLLLFLGILAAYWQPTLRGLWRVWLESDEYSSGLLVPFLAGYAVWTHRRGYLTCPFSPALSGLVLLAAAQLLRLFGLYFMFASAERIALVLSLGAAVLLLFGRAVFRRFLPVFLFLFLMLPLPNRIETLITLPLQEWATASAVYSLEVIGYSPVRQGNVIQIGQTLVAVAEACNGLRMLTAFFVISGFIVLISSRKWMEKAFILASTIPVALLCNTIRLTLTSIVFTLVDSKEWEVFCHDFGGILMMPLAIAMIVFELWLLKCLFYPPQTMEPVVVLGRKK